MASRHRWRNCSFRPENVAQGIGQTLLERVRGEAKTLEVRCLEVRAVARNRDAISPCHGAAFRLSGRVELLMELRTSAPDK